MAVRRRTFWLLIILAAVTLGLSVSLWLDNSFGRQFDRALEEAYARAAEVNQRGVVVKTDMQQVTGDMEAFVKRGGTNNIGAMLSWIESAGRPPSALRQQAKRLGVRYRIKNAAFWNWALDGTRHTRAFFAAKTFHIFGADAQWAFPRLQQLAATNGFAKVALDRLAENPGPSERK